MLDTLKTRMDALVMVWRGGALVWFSGPVGIVRGICEISASDRMQNLGGLDVPRVVGAYIDPRGVE